MTEQKRTGELDWENVRFFLGLARHHTLSATARALGVNHATVSRRIAALEKTIGRSLFDRRAHGYALNAAGRAVHSQAQRMEAAASGLVEQIPPDDTISGLVRITLTRSLADGFVSAHLGRLLAAHPGLTIEVLTDSRNLSLARHEADLALRLGRPATGDLTIRRIATLSYGFYAHRAYRDRIDAGEPAVFAGFDEDSAAVPEAAWAARHLRQYRVILRSNSQLSQAAFVAGGTGVALLPDLLARRLPELVNIRLHPDPPSREVWLVMRPRHGLRIPRLRLVADFLSGLFAAT